MYVHADRSLISTARCHSFSFYAAKYRLTSLFFKTVFFSFSHSLYCACFCLPPPHTSTIPPNNTLLRIAAINETLHAKPGEKEVQYKEEKTEQWSNTVMDKCLAKLAGRESKYKYSVTCVLMQKNGAGLVTSSSQYWEKHDADLYVPVPWENNSIHCIVTIFVSSKCCDPLEN